MNNHQLNAKAAVLLLTMGLVHAAGAQSYTLTNVWQVANGTPSTHIVSGTANRGMAYNALSNQVLVTSTSAKAIDVFDGNTGTFFGFIDASWATTGNAAIDQVGVADDGVIYACNLQVTAANGVKIYRWQSWTDTNQTTAYSGAPTNGIGGNPRFGDTMVVKGSGVNTVIAMGVNNSAGSSNIVLFSTLDGTNFLPTTVGISGLPSGASGVSWGLSFYTNNTLLVRPASGSSSGTLYEAQYPVNFASFTNSAVTGAMIASTPLNGGQWLQVSYNDPSKLLALHGNATTFVGLDVFPSFGAGVSSVATTTFSGPSISANGNETGIVALGGAGNTNYVYTLDTGSGLLASQIIFTPAAVPPTIPSQPVGGTVYTNVPSFTFTVSPNGTAPFTYQWQYNTVSDVATATNIPNATNSILTINHPVVANSGWYNVLVSNAGGGPTSSVPAQLTILQPLLSPVVTNVWTLAPGSRPYLGASDYATRGIAYDTNTGTVLVSDHVTTNIYVLNATNGNDLFAFTNLSAQGVTSGTFPLNLIGVGDDGVVYFANLFVPPGDSAFFVYSYSAVVPNPSAALAYTGDPGNGSGDRWGDTLAVRGAGVNTQILLGSYLTGTSVALLTTSDGANFSALNIPVPGASAGFASQGLCFGAGNTFWAKGVGGNEPLLQVSFDPTGQTPAAILQSYSNGMPTDMTGLGVDAANNILAGVTFTDTPYDLRLFQLTGTTNNPTLFHQAFFPQVNVNAQENAMSTVKFPRTYSINANNGILALTYAVLPASVPPFQVTATVTAGTVVLNWPSVSGHTYNVLSSANLNTARSTWTTNASYAGTGSTLSFTNAAPSGGLFYAIQAQ